MERNTTERNGTKGVPYRPPKSPRFPPVGNGLRAVPGGLKIPLSGEMTSTVLVAALLHQDIRLNDGP